MDENKVEANVNTCAKCGKELEDFEVTYILDSDDKNAEERVCASCSETVQDEYYEETTDVNFIGAVLGGLVGAAIGVGVWYLIAILFDLTIGIVAIGVGFLVAQGAMFASGKKRGFSLQIISLIITILAIYFAEYLVFSHFFNEMMTEFLGAAHEFYWMPLGEFTGLLIEYMIEELDFIGLIIWALGLWTAFATPAAKKLKTKS